ncbi:hypothetical protein JCM10908_006940 [Rhodotorula pacifica]|uniref:uncharacterized protein n=1 Tax=Rhodotorula pacifica TaxID=1495444 RepID=UPI0031774D78
MPALLPLELQMYILRLAVPPPVFKHLEERTRVCLAFSLVHRSWTETAQKLLRQHFVALFDYSLTAGSEHRLEERISAWQQVGGRIDDVAVAVAHVNVYGHSSTESIYLIFGNYTGGTLPSTLRKLVICVSKLDVTSRTLDELRFLAMVCSTLRYENGPPSSLYRSWAPNLEVLIDISLVQPDFDNFTPHLRIAILSFPAAEIRRVDPVELPESLQRLEIILRHSYSLSDVAVLECAEQLRDELAACPAGPALQIIVRAAGKGKDVDDISKEVDARFGYLD